MQKFEWYVVQVETGHERRMIELVERLAREYDALHDKSQRLVDECFSPRYLTRRKCEGVWVDEEKSLLPGYVVVVTHDPWALAGVLHGTREFARVVTMGKTIVPLDEDERAWIEDWTRRGDRTIPLSIAYKQGDAVVVTKGPLKGREGMIVRINRRKCQAIIELHVGGKRVTTRVGLAVLPTA